MLTRVREIMSVVISFLRGKSLSANQKEFPGSDLSQIEAEGGYFRLKGYGRGACPYPRGTKEYLAFHVGYNKQKERSLHEDTRSHSYI